MSKKELPAHEYGRTYINAEEAKDILFWSERFNISPNTLRDAIYAVGPVLSAVKNYLRKVRGMAV